MTAEKQRSPLQRFFSSRLFLLVALLIAVLLAIGYARAYYQDYKIREEIRALEDEVARLERKRLESFDILQYVTSPAFVEEKARTELHLQKPGERVLVIDGLAPGDEREETDLDTGQSFSNPLKWWYYFTRHALP